MANVVVKKSAAATWSVSVEGVEAGVVSFFWKGSKGVFCHSLLVKRGAVFPSLKAAVASMVEMAA
jgi:hypothetical protein